MSEHQELLDAIGLLITEQRQTNEAITQLAEALAGISKDAPAEKPKATPRAKASVKETQPKKEEPVVETPEPTAEPETPEPKWAEPNCTKDQLQSYCLERVRADKTFKSTLTATLGKYGVKTISKLKDGDAPKVYAELEGAE